MVRIAAVSRDEETRLQLARAFDAAPASWSVSLHDELPADADVIVCGPDVRADGCISFDPRVPERLVTDIAALTPSVRGKRVFVVGAAGGNGATSLALHLAAAAGACAIEGIPGGIRRRLDMDLARSWDGAALELSALPVAPGLRVLLSPGPSATEGLAEIAERAASQWPVVFVDIDPDGLDAVVKPGDLGVLVMVPTRPAAEMAREIVGRRHDLRWAIVSNRVGPGSELTRTQLEKKVGRKLAIELPCCAALRDAEDRGRLLTSPLSPWLWKVKRLWRALDAT